MHHIFELIRATRSNFLTLLEDIGMENANIIPEGFNNNVAWNFAHIIAAQQAICYKLSGCPVPVGEELIATYTRGTKPEAFISADEIAEFGKISAAALDRLEADFKAGIFHTFKTFTTPLRYTMSDIEGAITFIAVHDATMSFWDSTNACKGHFTTKYFCLMEPTSYTIPAATRIGHVHLKVSDLARAEQFYVGLLGFEVVTRYGTQATFISAGGYHHHIGLNTWYSKGGPPAPEHSAGLFHTAILFAERKDLAIALKRLLDARYPITGASDHGVSEAIYLDDPDGNGVELYWDRPRECWPLEADGSIKMFTEALDVDDLLRTIPAS